VTLTDTPSAPVGTTAAGLLPAGPTAMMAPAAGPVVGVRLALLRSGAMVSGPGGVLFWPVVGRGGQAVMLGALTAAGGVSMRGVVVGSRSRVGSPVRGGPGPAPQRTLYGAGTDGVASGGSGLFFFGAAMLLAVLGLGLPRLVGRLRLVQELELFPQFVLLLADPG
jgi:hypothetical protein